MGRSKSKFACGNSCSFEILNFRDGAVAAEHRMGNPVSRFQNILFSMPLRLRMGECVICLRDADGHRSSRLHTFIGNFCAEVVAEGIRDGDVL